MGSLARSSAVRLHGMGVNNQNWSSGGMTAEVSGLVSGVSIGVRRGVASGVEEWLLSEEEESILSARS